VFFHQAGSGSLVSRSSAYDASKHESAVAALCLMVAKLGTIVSSSFRRDSLVLPPEQMHPVTSDRGGRAWDLVQHPLTRQRRKRMFQSEWSGDAGSSGNAAQCSSRHFCRLRGAFPSPGWRWFVYGTMVV